MLDALKTCFSEPLNTRPPLATVGGGLDYSGAVLTAMTVADATRFGYLLYLSACCLVAGTTQGDWTLRNSGGATLVVLRQPFDTPSPGVELCWPFPHPWKTALVNQTFTIQGSVATMGTWRFIANGFRSAT